MIVVLDTNVVSELMKPAPADAVREWVLARAGQDLYTTAITLAEILYGIERLPKGRRKEVLRNSAAESFAAFEDHVLPFDTDAATHYASVVDSRRRLGQPIDGFDAQIASICRARRAALATRNTTDFHHTGVDTIDPWQAA